MYKVLLLILALVFSGCASEEDLEPDIIRGDDKRAINCYQYEDDIKIYNTAAKFKLAVPVWALNLPAENEFNPDCEIKSLKLHFAYVDNELIPIPHPGSKHPGSPKLPKFYDKITFYINFRSPDKPELHKMRKKIYCSNKRNVHNYPEYGFRLCPYLIAEKNINIDSFPFYPRFEIIEDKAIPTSLTCRHEDISGYTLENIYEMDIPYSCRGSWYWRKGASSMFDISKGSVLKKASRVIAESETLLNSWVIE